MFIAFLIFEIMVTVGGYQQRKTERNRDRVGQAAEGGPEGHLGRPESPPVAGPSGPGYLARGSPLREKSVDK